MNAEAKWPNDPPVPLHGAVSGPRWHLAVRSQKASRPTLRNAPGIKEVNESEHQRHVRLRLALFSLRREQKILVLHLPNSKRNFADSVLLTMELRPKRGNKDS